MDQYQPIDELALEIALEEKKAVEEIAFPCYFRVSPKAVSAHHALFPRYKELIKTGNVQLLALWLGPNYQEEAEKLQLKVEQKNLEYIEQSMYKDFYFFYYHFFLELTLVLSHYQIFREAYDARTLPVKIWSEFEMAFFDYLKADSSFENHKYNAPLRTDAFSPYCRTLFQCEDLLSQLPSEMFVAEEGQVMLQMLAECHQDFCKVPYKKAVSLGAKNSGKLVDCRVNVDQRNFSIAKSYFEAKLSQFFNHVLYSMVDQYLPLGLSRNRILHSLPMDVLCEDKGSRTGCTAGLQQKIQNLLFAAKGEEEKSHQSFLGRIALQFEKINLQLVDDFRKADIVGIGKLKDSIGQESSHYSELAVGLQTEKRDIEGIERQEITQRRLIEEYHKLCEQVFEQKGVDHSWVPWKLLPAKLKESYDALLQEGQITDLARAYLKKTVAPCLVDAFLEEELPTAALRDLTTINGERITDVVLQRLSKLSMENFQEKAAQKKLLDKLNQTFRALELLVQYGADLMARNQRGQTAFDLSNFPNHEFHTSKYAVITYWRVTFLAFKSLFSRINEYHSFRREVCRRLMEYADTRANKLISPWRYVFAKPISTVQRHDLAMFFLKLVDKAERVGQDDTLIVNLKTLASGDNPLYLEEKPLESGFFGSRMKNDAKAVLSMYGKEQLRAILPLQANAVVEHVRRRTEREKQHRVTAEKCRLAEEKCKRAEEKAEKSEAILKLLLASVSKDPKMLAGLLENLSEAAASMPAEEHSSMSSSS